MEHQDSFTEGGIQFFLAKSGHLWEWEGALFIIKLYLSNQDRHPTFTLFFALLTTSLFYQLRQLFLSQRILFKKLLVIEWLKDRSTLKIVLLIGVFRQLTCKVFTDIFRWISTIFVTVLYLFLLFCIPIFVFHTFSALCGFNCAFYMISFSLLF